jgi:two-component sensor histidine kinase
MQSTILPAIDPIAQAESDHRIANNLALLAALLELDGRDVGDPYAARVLDATRRRIHAIASIHRRLYRSEFAGEVDAASYLVELVGDLQAMCLDAGGRRRLVVHAAPLLLAADQAASLGILVAELVSNCCKHGYPKDMSGEIRIVITPFHRGSWQLMVEDDGIGFDRHCMGEPSGMGMELIDATASRLKANYVWQDGNPGTRFVLWKHDATDPAFMYGSQPPR